MTEPAGSLEEQIAQYNQEIVNSLSVMCGVSSADVFPIVEILVRRLGEPRWVDRNRRDWEDTLLDGGMPLSGAEDPDQGLLVWHRTPSFIHLVGKLVQYLGAATALHFVETDDLDRLERRVELLSRLLRHPLYLTTDELAVRAEAFLHYLEQNRTSLLATGYPATWFVTWPAPLAVNLYPVRYPRNLLNPRLSNGPSNQFIIPRPPLLWCRPHAATMDNNSLTTEGGCPEGTIPCRYDEVPLFDSRDADDASRLEEGRPALFDLKVRLVRRIVKALQRRSAIGLWDDCLGLLTETFLRSEVDAYLMVDYRRRIKLPEMGWIARFNVEELLPGGLTEWFELIGYAEKELTIGTMDRTKRALLGTTEPDEDDPYLSAIGTPLQNLIDPALDRLEARQAQEPRYWREFQQRVIAALQTEFIPEDGNRPLVKRQHAADVEPPTKVISVENRDYLDQTEVLPDPQSSQTRAVANRFRRMGKAWSVSFAGIEVPLQHSKGLYHIQYLLRHPGREVPALELVRAAEGNFTSAVAVEHELTPELLTEIGASSEGFGDAGPLLDDEARRQYRQRLNAMREEIADAQELGDDMRVESLLEEAEFLKEELNRGFGLGGRPRVADSAEEDARSAVTKAIDRALRDIAAVHPPLSEHLRAITTGKRCKYDPPGDEPPAWEF